MRSRFRRLPLAVTVLALLLVASSALAESVRVTTNRTNIWAAPNGTAGVIAVVDRDTVLEVKGRQGRWLVVDDPTNPRRTGYVLAAQTTPDEGRPLPAAAGASAPTPAVRQPQPPTSAPRTPTARANAPSRPAPRPSRAKGRSAFSTLFVYGGATAPVTSDTFEGTDSRSLNLEQDTRTTTYDGSTKPGFDVGIGSGAGRAALTVVVTRRQSTETAAVSAALPHPFYFNQPRTVTGAFDADRTETDVHVQVNLALLTTRRLQVVVGGGPSIFVVKQALLDTLRYDSSYPFDTATFTGASTAVRTEKGYGGHVELDVLAPLSRHVALQALGRWSRGTVDFSDDALKATSRVGNAQVGAGLRLSY
jgi:hypothetical protein